MPFRLTQIKKSSNITSKLSILKRERATLPWFCCLGRTENQQQPVVLLMTHLRVNRGKNTCHILQPWKAKLNDFTWTVAVKANTCNRLEGACRCNLHHAIHFPLANIMEVAVARKTNNRHQSLFCSYQSQPPIRCN